MDCEGGNVVLEVVCTDGNVVLIDIRVRLLPRTLRCLLGIEKDTHFSCVPETNEKGQLTFLKHYDVSQKNLLEYLIYLENEYISGDFDTLVRTARKFGECPALKKECELRAEMQRRRAEMQREREHAYNPQWPKDDYKEMYQWVKVDSTDFNGLRDVWRRGGTLTDSGLYRIPNKVDNEEEEKS